MAEPEYRCVFCGWVPPAGTEWENWKAFDRHHHAEHPFAWDNRDSTQNVEEGV